MCTSHGKQLTRLYSLVINKVVTLFIFFCILSNNSIFGKYIFLLYFSYDEFIISSKLNILVFSSNSLLLKLLSTILNVNEVLLL